MIRDFGQKLKAGGSGLFYFAGHGVQSKGRNYLIPVDADIRSETDVEDLSVDVNLVLGLMDQAENGLNIVILDACRNNPFSRSFRSTANGLAQMSAPTETLIAYATAPGSVASDGDGQNGLYTSELLKQMKDPGVPIEIVFKRVGTHVSAATNGRQEPWIALSLRGDFYFVAGSNTNGQASSVSVPPPITFKQPPPETRPAGGQSTPDANAIASKDIGSLRVVLKSMMRVKLKSSWGSSLNGIRCSFEFINLETQRPIVVAMNAMADNSVRISDHLRSTLVDENGGLWRLSNSDVAGMSIVGVGVQYWSGPMYSPAEIVTVLSKRDDLNSDVTDRPGGNQYRFIFGSTTEMSPGQSLTATMTFIEDPNQTASGAPPKVFQMATEIVVGLAKTGTKRSY